MEHLENDQAVLEVPGQVEHAWFDAERGEPESEDVGFVFAFGVDVLDYTIVFWLLVRTGPGVEEVDDKGKVSGEGEVLATVDGGRILQFFSSLDTTSLGSYWALTRALRLAPGLIRR